MKINPIQLTALLKFLSLLTTNEIVKLNKNLFGKIKIWVCIKNTDIENVHLQKIFAVHSTLYV